MFAAMIQDAPATLRGSDYVQLAIECEITTSMGADVPASKAPYVRESPADSIEFLAVAFEPVDLRGAAAGTGQDAAAGGPQTMGPFLYMAMDGSRGSFAKLWSYTNVVRFSL